ncbi:GntR family transcriptional regulator [Pseudonocardia sp. C8]|uniref:GntR family transcriptional regulator n=1 Tax=Pseudonocardia sp. C8 TaxID=2762759 RepID=UPI0016427CFA|nr:GntR family transcriptional regulator [Pseudonocardia sp. C8]MBC3194160.1 GntR family transcriptional regulator [Pseudonocardia sp. C8]
MTSGLGARAPKYQRIADELRREISERVYAPGSRMPAETDLTARFHVSLPTIRQALGVLRAEGLIESRHGIGTFVRENRKLQRRSRHRYGRARSDKQLLTSHLAHEILSAGPEETPQHIADVVADAPAFVVRRRLLRDKDTGRPEEIGASYVPAEFAAGTYLEEATVVPKALFLCVEELSGKTYAFARDRWDVRMPNHHEADLLDLAPGAAVVHLIHTALAEDSTLLEVSESIWPADRIQILDEYEITPDSDTGPRASEV